MKKRSIPLRWFAMYCLLGATLAWAQPYPHKPVKLIVGAGAGGTTDIVARLLAERLRPVLGQQVVVENRPGANGVIGTDVVAKSPADGYTLNLGSVSTHASNASLYSRLPYDPVRDFVAVALVGDAPYLPLVRPDFPAATLDAFIQSARARPGSFHYGAGTNAARIGTELIGLSARIKINHVPYRSTPQALADLLAGQIDLVFEPLVTALPQIKSGKLRALGVSSLARLPMLPNVPTMAESGLPGFEYTGWLAVYAPAGTPDDIVQKLNADINRILSNAEVVERMRQVGFEPRSGTAAQAAAFTRAEVAKYARVVKEAGIPVE
ncbi:MAG: hypothetical protein IOMNBAOH_01586 [Rhodocyclaceae bacterium]|nr:tripartite tricarboxylate transporter substrate binding protein [Rhodocyclaceae bacterium]MCG3187001.1 hypothetical protein [Rhodocyclaceae bacterium]